MKMILKKMLKKACLAIIAVLLIGNFVLALDLNALNSIKSALGSQGFNFQLITAFNDLNLAHIVGGKIKGGSFDGVPATITSGGNRIDFNSPELEAALKNRLVPAGLDASSFDFFISEAKKINGGKFTINDASRLGFLPQITSSLDAQIAEAVKLNPNPAPGGKPVPPAPAPDDAAINKLAAEKTNIFKELLAFNERSPGVNGLDFGDSGVASYLKLQLLSDGLTSGEADYLIKTVTDAQAARYRISGVDLSLAEINTVLDDSLSFFADVVKVSVPGTSTGDVVITDNPTVEVDPLADVKDVADIDAIVAKQKGLFDSVVADALKTSKAGTVNFNQFVGKLKAAGADDNLIAAFQGLFVGNTITDTTPFKLQSAITNKDLSRKVSAAFENILLDAELAKIPPVTIGGEVPDVNAPAVEVPAGQTASTELLDRVNPTDAYAAANGQGLNKFPKTLTALKAAGGIVSLLAGFLFYPELRPVQLVLDNTKLNHVVVFSCDSGYPTANRICLGGVDKDGSCSDANALDVSQYCSSSTQANGQFTSVKLAKFKNGYVLMLFANPSAKLSLNKMSEFWQSLFTSKQAPLTQEDLNGVGKVEGIQ